MWDGSEWDFESKQLKYVQGYQCKQSDLQKHEDWMKNMHGLMSVSVYVCVCVCECV